MGRDKPAYGSRGGRSVSRGGVAAAIVTDISRDGAQVGVDPARMEEIAKAVRIPVIASGGVASLDDIRALRMRFDAGVVGVIVGRAVYEGSFSLSDALAAATQLT